MDCSVFLRSENAADAWSGLDYLEGEIVDLIGDGAPLGQAVVAGGAVVTPYAVSTLEVGFAFDWAVETMPVEIGDGVSGGERYRLTRASIWVYRSAGLAVNGHTLSNRCFGETEFDAAPGQISGVRGVRFLGWSGGRVGNDGATVRITGSLRLSATILSVSSEIAQ